MGQYFSDTGAREFCGVFRGDGVNHDKGAFQGQFTGEAILGGQALRIQFVAHDSEGKVLHEEETVVSPDSQSGPLKMFSFNTRTGLTVLSQILEPEGPNADKQTLFPFATDGLEDDTRFRMRTTLKRLDSGTLEFAQEWALPGGELIPRSSVVLKRT